MMTRPIHFFDSLTSESTPAGGNMFNKVEFSTDERRMLEARARYARAEMVANVLTDGLLWLGKRYSSLVSAMKADLKLRTSEAQLYRMSDRELSDLGLSRADIPFAVRQAVGIAPAFDVTGGSVAPANQNLRHAA